MSATNAAAQLEAHLMRPAISVLGHGSGAHAPDEYYVIESANPNVQGSTGR